MENRSKCINIIDILFRSQSLFIEPDFILSAPTLFYRSRSYLFFIRLRICLDIEILF